MSATGAVAACALLPTCFISHGAGPAFFMHAKDSMLSEIDADSKPARAFRDVGLNPTKYGLPAAPDAIAIVSAHWEESDAIHVLATPSPQLLYDYYGFPKEMYEIAYPAPGQPALAQDIVQMINNDAAFTAQTTVRAVLDTSNRGWDHGVFLPLKLFYPKADIPVVQISLHSSLNPALHAALGRALQPLRSRNVFILCSGQTTHPMATRSGGLKAAQFEDWLETVLYEGPADNRVDRALAGFADANVLPLIRFAHNPRTEHFTPLIVALAASGGSRARELFGHSRKNGTNWNVLGGAFSLASFIFDQ